MATPRYEAADRFAAAKLARADLYFFSRWMFLQRKGFHWQRAQHHRIICDALMRVFGGQCPRLIINVPPRFSKTELAVVNFIAWYLGRVPDAEFIHASYSSTLAIDNSADILDLVRHEAYREIFPGMQVASEPKNHWTTTTGGVMYAAGAGGTITGFGAGKTRDGPGGVMVIDDPIKSDEARSETVRRNVIDWFQNTMESRMNSPHTPVVLIMQRLHVDDLAGWLLKGGNGEQWEHVCLPALLDDGTALWPEKKSVDELRRLERASPYVYAGQYQQRPAPIKGGVFKPDAIEIVDAAPAGTTWVRGWDFGATVDGNPTAGLLLGRTPDERYVIGDVVHGRWGPDDRDRAMVNAAKRDGSSVQISIPQDPGQAGKTQVLDLAKKLAGFKLHASPESGDKITRSEPFASQVNIGNVLMVRGAWNDGVIDEMRMFPNAADDRIDAASRAFALLITLTNRFAQIAAMAGVAVPAPGQVTPETPPLPPQQPRPAGGLLAALSVR